MRTAIDLDSVFDRAVTAFKAGDIDAAAASGEMLLQHASFHPATQNLMGLIRLRQGRPEEAVNLFAAAANSMQNDPAVLRNLGNALKHANRIDESLAVYEKAVTLAPGDASALYDLARTQEYADRPNDAADTYQRVLKLDPGHSSAAASLAALLVQRGVAEDGLAALDAAIAARPEDIDLLMTYSSALRRAGRPDEAVARHREALARCPDSAKAHATLAFRLGEVGEHEEAAEVYRKGLALAPDDANALANLGWTLVELGRHGEALEPCERAVALDPDVADAHYYLALARRGTGDPNGAAAALERALQIDRRHVRALSILGEIREELGHADAARRIFDPDRMIARRVLTDVPGFASIADFNAALADAVHSHPTSTWNPAGRATVMGNQTLELVGDASAALQAFRQCVDAAVRQYIAARAKDAAPGEFFDDPPQRWDLTIWGVELRPGGHQISHTHPSGFASGVYYPDLPAAIGAGPDGEEGFIEFSSSSGRDDDGAMAALRHRVALRPEEGHMLLFPSYFWHRTIPYAGAERRISVAFDAVPRP